MSPKLSLSSPIIGLLLVRIKDVTRLCVYTELLITENKALQRNNTCLILQGPPLRKKETFVFFPALCGSFFQRLLKMPNKVIFLILMNIKNLLDYLGLGGENQHSGE